MKAILQYEDGKTIDLTSSTSSRIVTSDGLVLVNDSLKGLRFDQGELENRPMKYHTLAVPVGGEYHFTLVDGTQVWVNSASEVRFPNCFPGKGGDLRKGRFIWRWLVMRNTPLWYMPEKMRCVC